MKKFEFKESVPVWETGTLFEKNYTLIFRANIKSTADAFLNLAAHSFYQVFLDGKFLCAGPARAGHDFYRVDNICLGKLKKETELDIFVTGYNTDTFCCVNEPSFLCAEVVCEDEVLAATGRFGFSAARYEERVQKVQRLSYQRAYAEYYKIAPGKKHSFDCVLEDVGNKNFIEREVYYPEYKRVAITNIISRGTAEEGELIREYNDRAITEILTERDGFLRDELVVEQTKEVGKIKYTKTEQKSVDAREFFVQKNGFVTLKTQFNNTGFIELLVEAESDVKLFVMFDETIDNDGEINYTRNTITNVIVYELKKGNYTLVSSEPNTFKYIRITALGSGIKVSELNLIEYKFPEVDIECNLKNSEDIKIFNAALESFRQSTLDIYMDCPSRERAGWLCDSFFMGRVEKCLTGKNVVEKNFLENFLMYDSIRNIPDGMIPMLYPADFRTELFIPNWAMWFVLELEDYLKRSGDKELILKAKEKVYKLIGYFKMFENEFSMLEKLENWVFIEWSKANDYINDINFPTNMLYFRMKEAVGRLYEDEKLLSEAKELKEKIIEISYKDGFFHDRAMREEDGIRTTDEITETAQYYAFFMGIADVNSYRDLWETLLAKFGNNRRDADYPEIAKSNSFIGNYLRLDLMRQFAPREKLLEETRSFFGYMAEETGTLWEDVSGKSSSLCHGFASYVLLWYLD